MWGVRSSTSVRPTRAAGSSLARREGRHAPAPIPRRRAAFLGGLTARRRGAYRRFRHTRSRPRPARRPGARVPEILRTTCTRDCPDACAILATVEDGRVVSIAGDKTHPVTRGFLCERTNRYL